MLTAQRIHVTREEVTSFYTSCFKKSKEGVMPSFPLLEDVLGLHSAVPMKGESIISFLTLGK